MGWHRSFGQIVLFSLLSALALSLSGCVKSHPTIPKTSSLPATNSPLSQGGASVPYHVVSKGETLWRICKNYGVDMQDVIRLNHIKDPNAIEVGQKIYLPNTASLPRSKFQFADGYNGVTERQFRWPVKGNIVSFYRQSKDGWVNKGIEVLARSSVVVAPKTGKVVFLGKDMRPYRNTLIIDHGDGFVSVIASDGEVLVSVGEVVERGKTLIKIEPGTKVHYEIRRGTKPVNPLAYLK